MTNQVKSGKRDGIFSLVSSIVVQFWPLPPLSPPPPLFPSVTQRGARTELTL